MRKLYPHSITPSPRHKAETFPKAEATSVVTDCDAKSPNIFNLFEKYMPSDQNQLQTLIDTFKQFKSPQSTQNTNSGMDIQQLMQNVLGGNLGLFKNFPIQNILKQYQQISGLIQMTKFIPSLLGGNKNIFQALSNLGGNGGESLTGIMSLLKNFGGLSGKNA